MLEDTYSLTYEVNGGDEGTQPTDGNSYIADDVAKLVKDPAPTHPWERDGATIAPVVFIGWTAEPDAHIYRKGEEAPATIDRVTFAGSDESVHAVWGFDTNGNGTPDVLEDWFTITYTDGVEGVELFKDQVYSAATDDATPFYAGQQPTREGYTFGGWSPAVAETVTGDATYTAVWNVNTYALSYEYEGDVPENAPAVPEATTVDYGDSVTVAAAPAVPGYEFEGWSRTGSFSMPAEDVVITGSWKAVEDTPYAIEYYQQRADGEGYDLVNRVPLTGTTGSQVEANVIEYEGFTRVDHALSNEADVVRGDGSTVLRVYYDRNTYIVRYAYSAGVPGASALPVAQIVRFGARVAVADAAQAPGYTFNGWTIDGVAADGTFSMPAGDVVIMGSFTANSVVPVPTPTPTPTPAPVVTPAAVTPVPTPAAPAAPAAPAPAAPAPAAATPAPAAEPIEDDATPQAAAPAERTPLAETEEIEDEATPMGAFDEPHCWVHWVMLLGILITAAYGAIVVRRRLHLADDVDDYEKQVLGIEAEAPEAVPATGRQAL